MGDLHHNPNPVPVQLGCMAYAVQSNEGLEWAGDNLGVNGFFPLPHVDFQPALCSCSAVVLLKHLSGEDKQCFNTPILPITHTPKNVTPPPYNSLQLSSFPPTLFFPFQKTGA